MFKNGEEIGFVVGTLVGHLHVEAATLVDPHNALQAASSNESLNHRMHHYHRRAGQCQTSEGFR